MEDNLTGSRNRHPSSVAGQVINRDAIHRVLYRRADRHHRLKVQLKGLAEELGVSYWNFTIIISRMVDEGRLRRLSGSSTGPKVFIVEDPAHWSDDNG